MPMSEVQTEPRPNPGNDEINEVLSFLTTRQTKLVERRAELSKSPPKDGRTYFGDADSAIRRISAAIAALLAPAPKDGR